MNAVTVIQAKTIGEAWISAVRELVKQAHFADLMHMIFRGSYENQRRIEFPYAVIDIEYPETRPLVPIMPDGMNIPPPFDERYLEEYACYIMTGHKPQNTEYTYGERLVLQYPQVVKEYRKLKMAGSMYTNQMCMEIGAASDMLLGDPPCCRVLDTNVKDGKLNFFMYFRSWDLWGGFPVNLAGFQLLKEYMADELEILPGRTIVSSKGLHIYDHCFPVAKLLSKKNPDEYRFVNENRI